MIESFSLERVNKAPASFDPEEALGLPGAAHAAAAGRREGGAWCCRTCERAGLCTLARCPKTCGGRCEHVVAAAGDRIKTAGDMLDYAYFFLPDDRLPYDEKAVRQVARDGRGPASSWPSIAQRLAAASRSTPQHLEAA